MFFLDAFSVIDPKILVRFDNVIDPLNLLKFRVEILHHDPESFPVPYRNEKRNLNFYFHNFRIQNSVITAST